MDIAQELSFVDECAPWQQGSLTTQAVLTQQGDIYYVYSGSWSGITPMASVSTGTFGGITWSSVPNGFGGQWALENPAEVPVVLRLAPRDASPLKLPLARNTRMAITNAIDVSACSSVLMKWRLGPAQAMATCNPVRYGEEGGLAAPTKQYSFIEVYDFNLVSMEGAQELAFAGESAQVNLLSKVPFGGTNYDKMFVSQKVRTAYAGSLEELQ
eukprot:m51a1_g13237 hypothetical protein (213) ;mRNA; f:600-2595